MLGFLLTDLVVGSRGVDDRELHARAGGVSDRRGIGRFWSGWLEVLELGVIEPAEGGQEPLSGWLLWRMLSR